MAIYIAGTTVGDMRSNVRESLTAGDRNSEHITNVSETLVTNIQASRYPSRTFIDNFPNMSTIEHDICGWF